MGLEEHFTLVQPRTEEKIKEFFDELIILMQKYNAEFNGDYINFDFTSDEEFVKLTVKKQEE